MKDSANQLRADDLNARNELIRKKPIELNMLYRWLFILSQWLGKTLGAITPHEITEDLNSRVIGYALRASGAQISDKAIWEWFLTLPSDLQGLNILKTALSHWGVKAKFLKITSFTPSKLSELQAGTILVFKNGQLLNYLGVSGAKIKIRDGHSRVKKIHFNDLAKLWEGVFLSIDIFHAFSVKRFKSERYRELWGSIKLGLWGCLIVCSAIFIGFRSFTTLSLNQQISWSALMLLGLLGLATSYALVKYFLFGDYSLPKFCQSNSQAHKNTCQPILTSPQSSFFGVSHADFGVIYYLTILAMLISTGLDSFLLYAISLLGLPYTLFSITYQKVIIKSWCKLCLIVQAVVLLQNSILLFNLVSKAQPLTLGLHVSINIFIEDILIVFSVIGIWSLVRFLIHLNVENKKLIRSNHKQIYDQNTYEKLIGSGRVVPSFDGKGNITIGHPRSTKNSVTIVLSTYCKQCAKTLDELVSVVNNGFWPVSLTILIKANLGGLNVTRTENSPISDDSKVARKIMALIIKGDQELALTALLSWYNNGHFVNYQYWESQFPNVTEEELILAEQSLNSIYNWTENHKIMLTPTVVINEKVLPEIYLSHEANLIRRLTNTNFLRN